MIAPSLHAAPANARPLVGSYRYRCINHQKSSSVLGPCEVCGEHVAEVFHQIETRFFAFSVNDEKFEGWTGADCTSLFGHLDCLESRRRDHSSSSHDLPTRHHNTSS